MYVLIWLSGGVGLAELWDFSGNTLMGVTERLQQERVEEGHRTWEQGT